MSGNIPAIPTPNLAHFISRQMRGRYGLGILVYAGNTHHGHRDMEETRSPDILFILLYPCCHYSCSLSDHLHLPNKIQVRVSPSREHRCILEQPFQARSKDGEVYDIVDCIVPNLLGGSFYYGYHYVVHHAATTPPLSQRLYKRNELSKLGPKPLLVWLRQPKVSRGFHANIMQVLPKRLASRVDTDESRAQHILAQNIFDKSRDRPTTLYSFSRRR
ncbi:Hypothetical predicted protein, partial [Paramuricea clavata]